MPDSPALANEPGGMWGESETPFQALRKRFMSVSFTVLSWVMQEKASEVLKPSIQSTSLGIKRASLHRQTASSKRRSELVWPEHGWQRNCSGPLLSGWPHWGAVPRSIPDRWLSGESGLPGQEAADTENTPIPGTWQPWPLASEGLVHPGTKQPLSSQAAHRWKGGNAFLPSPPHPPCRVLDLLDKLWATLLSSRLRSDFLEFRWTAFDPWLCLHG